MQCIKCGRDTEEEQTFCERCQTIMMDYPVDIGATVTLPSRKASGPVKKTVKRKGPTPEEQIQKLKKLNRRLILALAAAILLAAAMVIPTFRYIVDQFDRPGQNYSVIVPTTAPADSTKGSR